MHPELGLHYVPKEIVCKVLPQEKKIKFQIKNQNKTQKTTKHPPPPKKHPHVLVT